MKNLFGKGQTYKDKIALSERDYKDIVNACFSRVEKVQILDDFSEIDDSFEEHLKTIDWKLLDEYVKNSKQKEEYY